MKTFSTSGKLMEAVRKLDYKQQYKVCYAFYDEIIKYPQFDGNNHCLKFDTIYENINPDWLVDEKDNVQQCVEVMLEALRDIEMSELAAFQKIGAQIMK